MVFLKGSGRLKTSESKLTRWYIFVKKSRYDLCFWIFKINFVLSDRIFLTKGSLYFIRIDGWTDWTID